jgi:acyl carrier protein
MEFHDDIDYDKETKLVDNKLYDSFDLVTLVTELGQEFDIEITAEEFVPENFNSLETLTGMVERLLEE